MAYTDDTRPEDLTAWTDAAASDLVLGVDDPDGTPLLKVSTLASAVGYLVTAAGDILYATAARTLARLAKGTANQILTMNSGATAPEWSTLNKNVQLEPFGWAAGTTCATGDGKAYLSIPASLDGLSLVVIHGEVKTAGITGTMDMQVHNVTQAVDMLSTVLTWDTTEAGTDTAAAPAVIKSDDSEIVAAYDVLRLDFDAVHTTPAVGCIVTLRFG